MESSKLLIFPWDLSRKDDKFELGDFSADTVLSGPWGPRWRGSPPRWPSWISGLEVCFSNKSKPFVSIYCENYPFLSTNFAINRKLIQNIVIGGLCFIVSVQRKSEEIELLNLRISGQIFSIFYLFKLQYKFSIEWTPFFFNLWPRICIAVWNLNRPFANILFEFSSV